MQTSIGNVQTNGRSSDTEITDYIGNFVYEACPEHGEGTHLSFILIPDGRIVVDPRQCRRVEYFIKDHLGNTRSVVDGASGRPIEENSYYPFGMQIDALNYSNAAPENRYLYNGKELTKDFGLDWYEYGARNYDPVIARWSSVDPLAEEYYSMSPYIYVANSPMIFIDPDGRKIDPTNLTEEEQDNYNANVKYLQESEIFATYYKALEASETVYTISSGNLHPTTGKKVSGFFDPNTNNIEVGDMSSLYVMSQEIFHAFQYEGGFYDGNQPRPNSTLETEGDIVSMYVMAETYSSYPSIVAWGEEIENDLWINGLPDYATVTSDEYLEKFDNAVNNRIEHYKNKNMGDLGKTYTSENYHIEPKALQAILKSIEEQK